MNNIIIKIEKSLTKLINWTEKNGWASYDPYDVRALPFFLFLTRKQNFLKKIFLSFFYIMPVTLRRIFKIEPSVSATGMGFLAQGYIELYKVTKNVQNLEKAKKNLNWLEKNRIKDYKDYCWSYPFDWQSVVLFPENTPIGYVTAECAKVFMEYYRLTKDKKYLDIVVSICNFINGNLNKKYHKNNVFSFSYTPLDNSEVVNINAIIASVFFEAGQLTKNEELINIAEKIMQFVLQEQLPNGGWYYFSFGYKSGSSIIDNYHTAMVLQSINKIIILENNPIKKATYKKAIIKGLKFYLDNFFTNNGIPKITPNKIYPINIASCAEAITLFSQINALRDEISTDLFKKMQKVNKKLICWTIDNMQDRNGAFIERKYGPIKIKLYSIRWGQGLMLRALALAYSFYQKNKN